MEVDMGRRWNIVLAVGLMVGLLAYARQALGQARSAMAPVKGSILALDLKAAQPNLKLRDEAGKMLTFSIDPKVTKVLQDGQSVKLEALQVGQHVEVESTQKNGKQIAKSIELISPTPQGGAEAPTVAPRSESGAPATAPRVEPSTPSTTPRSGESAPMEQRKPY
jgi:hypothetical protein